MSSVDPVRHEYDVKEKLRVQYIKHTYLLNLYRIE